MPRAVPRQPASSNAPRGASEGRSWTFLSNHAHVLICVAANPSARIHDIAAQVSAGDSRIFGVMVESHLKAGRQDLLPGKALVYGKSITVACVGWEDTRSLIDELAAAVAGHIKAANEEMRDWMRAQDDRYRDLPPRVARLEAKVFAPKRRRTR